MTAFHRLLPIEPVVQRNALARVTGSGAVVRKVQTCLRGTIIFEAATLPSRNYPVEVNACKTVSPSFRTVGAVGGVGGSSHQHKGQHGHAALLIH
jgi:hypothetical protein